MAASIVPGTTVRVIRSHHNMNDHCVGQLGTVVSIVMRGEFVIPNYPFKEQVIRSKGIFRVRMSDGDFYFGYRDLQIISKEENK
jgi:hypothetical protein